MSLQRAIKPVLFVLIFGGVLLYSGFALRNALRGPYVTINPVVSPVEAPIITLTGTALRAETITVNTLPVPLTTEGTFSLTAALVEGSNEFVVEASDRFGTTHRERVLVWHEPTPLPTEVFDDTTPREDTESIDNP